MASQLLLSILKTRFNSQKVICQSVNQLLLWQTQFLTYFMVMTIRILYIQVLPRLKWFSKHRNNLTINVVFVLNQDASQLTKDCQVVHVLVYPNAMRCPVFVLNVNGAPVSANVTQKYAKDKNSSPANAKVPVHQRNLFVNVKLMKLGAQ